MLLAGMMVELGHEAMPGASASSALQCRYTHPAGAKQILLCAVMVVVVCIARGVCGLKRPPTLASHGHRLRIPHLPYSYQVRYFTQALDHFNFHSAASTFQQRYLISTEHWSGPDAPIFMYCGNEGDIVWFAENTGFMWELASSFGALLLFPEHRYYGESMPFGSQAAAYKDADSLAYLTAEQALADFVTLLTDLKGNISAEACPVVLFGGSYGGMLAAWMRLKYPHAAIGAIASSAPILQFEDLVPTDTYYRIVSEGFKRESRECFETIQQSWNELEAVGQAEGGLQILTDKFQMCRQLNNTADLEDWIFSAYSYLAMVNYPYSADFIMPLPAFPIKEACTEMVMPMSSNPNNSMFPPGTFDLKQFEDGCLEQFGVKPRPTWITQEFGGHNIKEVLRNFGSNIVFSNGLLDPWSGGGVLNDISSTIVAVVTEEGAHHLDLRSSTEDDPEWLIQQRQVEVAHIKSWLLQYHNQHYAHALA